MLVTDQIKRHLDNDQVAWLTTVTAGGRPAPRPVWFVWDGSTIIVYSLNDSAKLRHLRTHDQVSVHFNSTTDGRDVVVIHGRAEIVPDASNPSQYPGLLEKYAARIEQMGRTPQWYDDNYGTPLRVIPERAWTIPQ